jgi:replicative DNA helicase
MRIYSAKSEFLIIRALCSKRRDVSGKIMASVDAEYFHTKEASEAYTHIMKYVGSHGQAPAFEALLEEPRLSEKTRISLSNISGRIRNHTQLQQTLDNLSQYRKARACVRLGQMILETMQEDKIDVDNIVHEIQQKAAKLSLNKSLEDTIHHIGRDSNVLEIVEELIYGEDTTHVIPTGFNTWDGHNGGFIRGSLVVLGLTTGGGKSLLANQMAMNQARLGYKVNMVPLEMTLKEILGRQISNLSKIENSKIQFKRLATGEKDLAFKRWKRFDRQVKRAGGRYTTFKPNEDVTIEETFGALHSFKADVNYLDYMGLFKGSDAEDQWRKLSAMCRHAKVYADNSNSVVVALVQVSEEGIVRYSRGMVEHAGTGFIAVATKESREQGYIKFNTIKARNQTMMDFTLGINYATQWVGDMTQDERQTIEEAQKESGRKKRDRSAEESTDEDDKYLPDMTGD